MIEPKQIFSLLQSQGISLYTGVPDSLLKDFCAYITDNSSETSHIIAANEGNAIAIASGHYLSTGKIAMVYMQNSGIGNAINPLLSLADEKVYNIPMLLMIGWRGEPGIKDEPQHIKQGEVTLALLDAMQICYTIIDNDENIAIKQFSELVSNALIKSTPHAAIIRKNVFTDYKLKKQSINHYEMSREEALKVIIDSMNPEDIVVSSTGKLSRELFEYREAKKDGHGKDFLTVGSMGHSSSIALGIALNTDKNVYCLDGDGSAIMHMGVLSNIGVLGLKNFKHIIFNNGAHESVGGQPTVGLKIDLANIAKYSGYNAVYVVENRAELTIVAKKIQRDNGPILLEIKINTNSRKNLGRPTTTTIENKRNFMENFKS